MQWWQAWAGIAGLVLLLLDRIFWSGGWAATRRNLEDQFRAEMATVARNVTDVESDIAQRLTEIQRRMEAAGSRSSERESATTAAIGRLSIDLAVLSERCNTVAAELADMRRVVRLRMNGSEK